MALKLILKKNQVNVKSLTNISSIRKHIGRNFGQIIVISASLFVADDSRHVSEQNKTQEFCLYAEYRNYDLFTSQRKTYHQGNNRPLVLTLKPLFSVLVPGMKTHIQPDSDERQQNK